MLKTNRQNYAKQLRRLNRLMDAADSGVDCADKIQALAKSIGKFEDKRYPIFKRRRFIFALRTQYRADIDQRRRFIFALRTQYRADIDQRHARRGNHSQRRGHTQIRRLLGIFNKNPMTKNWPDVAKDELARAITAP